MSELEASASQAGWVVSRQETPEDAARYIESLAGRLEARSAVCSAHPVLDRLHLEERLTRVGVELRLMAIDEDAEGSEIQRTRQSLREFALDAGLGITGVDYAIAETGSCVLLAGKGVSRLVSLLPPVHVAVVERGQVLPSLDELFVLHRSDLLGGEPASYMNIISGPSRSADIEQTLVTGVHGPREAHLLLLG
jgi:L-lactate dehydrogenase complex protein LldG